MKNNFIIAILALSCFIKLTAQVNPTPPPFPPRMPNTNSPGMPMPVENKQPEIVQFNELIFNFDTIKQGTPASHIFEFNNVGTKDINLDNVQASCGCTTPNWKAGAYKPGETSQINATYNAAGEGYFEKNITVVTSEGTQMLTIKGVVISAATYDAWKIGKDIRDAAKAKAEAFAKMTPKQKKGFLKAEQKAKKAALKTKK
ncbi:MAG: DUF1573 domain-containing protein [Bacteroidetes bacterium]|nr:DUF1573 domain-containing protein [Bacteroidota bacterium]